MPYQNGGNGGRRDHLVHFTLSGPPSTPSSRTASPAPYDAGRHNARAETTDRNSLTYDDIYDYKSQEKEVLPGQHSMDVYDATLPWWRAAIRRKLVKAVERESGMIAAIQVSTIAFY